MEGGRQSVFQPLGKLKLRFRAGGLVGGTIDFPNNMAVKWRRGIERCSSLLRKEIVAYEDFDQANAFLQTQHVQAHVRLIPLQRWNHGETRQSTGFFNSLSQ